MRRRNKDGRLAAHRDFRYSNSTTSADHKIGRRQVAVHVTDIFHHFDIGIDIDLFFRQFTANCIIIIPSCCQADFHISDALKRFNNADHSLIDPPCALTSAKSKQHKILLSKSQILSRLLPVHPIKAFSYRIARRHMLFRISKILRAFFKSQEYFFHMFFQHFISHTREGILFMDVSRNMHFLCHFYYRGTCVSACSDYNIRLKFFQNLL